MRSPCFLLLASALAAAPPASAALFTVGNGDGCTHRTLGEATFAALLNGPGADEIRVVTQASAAAALVVGGSLVIDGSYASCDATEPTPGRRAVLFGDGDRSSLHITDGHVTVRNLSMTGGGTRARNSAGEYVRGGAISITGGTVTLVDVNLYDNDAERGGAIAVQGLQTRLRILDGPLGTTLRGNHAEDGGGLYIDRAGVRADNRSTTIIDNVAERYGGGIAMQSYGPGLSTLLVTWPDGPAGEAGGSLDGFRVWGNRALRGGGIFMGERSDVSAAELWVANNLAGESGGGLVVYKGATLEMRRRLLDEPERAACGTIHGCNRITGNTARERGGGLFVMGGRAHLRQVLLAGNDSLDAFAGSALATGSVVGVGPPDNIITLESTAVAGNRCLPGQHLQESCATLDVSSTDTVLTLAHVTIAGNGLGTSARRTEIDKGQGTLSIRSSIIEPGAPDVPVMRLDVPASVDCLMAPAAYGTRALVAPLPYAFVDREALDYRVAPRSAAIDACDAALVGDVRTGDPGFRVHGAIDDVDVPNRFDATSVHDLGAFEMGWPVREPFHFADGFE